VLFLNKLLPIFVLPLGWVVALTVFGLVRKKRWPIITALVLLYVSSTTFVGNRLLHGLETRYPTIPIEQAPKVDAIVPLGGIFGPAAGDGFLSNLGEANERLEAGIVLWQKQKADWLVFTGGRVPWSTQHEVEGTASKRASVARGVPDDKIIVTGEVGNTADEAAALASLVREHHWSTILLVTSAWHMPRSARLFRKAGVSFVPFPVDVQIDTRGPLTLLDFLPRADGLHNTECALREWYGIAFYALTGR
jgi:uncharacterized SAM-binding protein YcdF (DUF218 family)